MTPRRLFAIAGGAALVVASCKGHRSSPPLPMLVIDTATGTVSNRIDVPDYTYDVALDHATGDLWLVSETIDGDFSTQISRLTIGSAGKGTLVTAGTIPPALDLYGHPLPVGGEYYFNNTIAVDSTNRRGAFTSPRSDELRVLDLDNFQLVGREVSSYLEHGVALAPDTHRGYATGFGILYSFDELTGALPGQDLCPSTDLGIGGAIAYARTTHRVYVAAGKIGLSAVCVYDPVTNAAAFRDYGCGILENVCLSTGFALSRDESRLFIANPAYEQATSVYAPPSITILDLTSGGQPDVVIPDLAMPQHLKLSPDGNTLYVSEVRCNRLGVYDANSGAHRYDISTDGPILGFEISTDGKTLFIPQQRRDGPFGRVAEYVGRNFDPCPDLVPKP